MAPGREPGGRLPSPDFYFEARLWDQGYRYVAGIDEAGRGALAGPVAVGAVIFPAGPNLQSKASAEASAEAMSGVNDSKVIKPAQREYLAARIQTLALAWQVGYAQAEEIDALGILAAVRLAARRALDGLSVSADSLITDYLELPDCPLPQIALVKGDARSLSVAAASILAKTARDALLRELASSYPGYGLDRHKGYGTFAHRAALERLGPSAIHRQSFALLKQA